MSTYKELTASDLKDEGYSVTPRLNSATATSSQSKKKEMDDLVNAQLMEALGPRPGYISNAEKERAMLEFKKLLSERVAANRYDRSRIKRHYTSIELTHAEVECELERIEAGKALNELLNKSEKYTNPPSPTYMSAVGHMMYHFYQAAEYEGVPFIASMSSGTDLERSILYMTRRFIPNFLLMRRARKVLQKASLQRSNTHPNGWIWKQEAVVESTAALRLLSLSFPGLDAEELFDATVYRNMGQRIGLFERWSSKIDWKRERDGFLEVIVHFASIGVGVASFTLSYPYVGTGLSVVICLASWVLAAILGFKVCERFFKR